MGNEENYRPKACTTFFKSCRRDAGAPITFPPGTRANFAVGTGAEKFHARM